MTAEDAGQHRRLAEAGPEARAEGLVVELGVGGLEHAAVDGPAHPVGHEAEGQGGDDDPEPALARSGDIESGQATTRKALARA